MNQQKLDSANALRERIAVLSMWLEGHAANLSYGPSLRFAGVSGLGDETQRKIKALAKEDVERQLSQLRQEFEAL